MKGLNFTPRALAFILTSEVIIQRVKSASVSVDEELISSIGRGLLVFAGVGQEDTEKEADTLVNKVLKAKFWPDENGVQVRVSRGVLSLRLILSTSAVEKKCTGNRGRGSLWYAILSFATKVELYLPADCAVSQFTLYAKMKKGNKPDFHDAAKPDVARRIYDHFYNKMSTSYVTERVKNGVFQAMMDVELKNDGPVGVDYRSEDAAVHFAFAGFSLCAAI